MLEAKISEAGPYNQRVRPSIVNLVFNNLVREGELQQLYRSQDGHIQLYSFAALPPDDLDTILAQKIELSEIFNRHAFILNSLGRQGEVIVEKACVASPFLRVLQPFGDVSYYDGVRVEHPSDGLIAAVVPTGSLPATDSIALVEIKNRREWIYPEDYRIWKLIRNAYAMNIVGVFMARRIMHTTFGYVFKRVGAVGVELFAQFAPPETEPELRRVRHKDGLGYHDLYFKSTVPSFLQKQIDRLGDRILVARKRMLRVRGIVEPFLPTLANENIKGAIRNEAFQELNSELLEFDRNIADQS